MKKLPDQRGSMLLVFLLVLPTIILIALYYMNLSLTSFQVARLDQLHTEAQLAADAGADFAVEQFSQDNTWTGASGDVTLHSDSKLKTTYNASISGTTSAKTVTVTGKTYWPASSTTPRRTVKIYVDLRPITSGNYSIVAGEGGLYLSNSSKVVSGSVVVNGELQMSNNSQIGLSINPVLVQVANQRCPNPPDSTYPRLCNSGENGQPITISNAAHIYGQVTANGQTDGSGMSNPGLSAGSVTPQTLPTYDRAAQKAAVTNTMSSSDASCSGKQAVTWPANTKITGDVSLSSQCTVTIAGNVWITGNLSFTNSVLMKVADSLGSTRPVIMVDGPTGVNFANNTDVVSNTSGTGVEFITFYSKASCSPDCTSVTGTDLANSRVVSTISLNNAFLAPNVVLYAYWSQIQVYNAGSIGALIGQTISMSNNSSVTFGGNSGVGQTVWVIKGYRRQ